jgi:hypothetical protein
MLRHVVNHEANIEFSDQTLEAAKYKRGNVSLSQLYIYIYIYIYVCVCVYSRMGSCSELTFHL